jgi:hypothetical protein
MENSNYTFVQACYTQSTEDWIAVHKAWFEFLEGVPPLVVCDNLKAAVIKGGKDFKLNKAYQELARHYGFNILPARAYHPQDKARVEGEVRHAAYGSIMSKLRGKAFFSLEELNAAIAPLNNIHNEKPLSSCLGSRSSGFAYVDSKRLRELPIIDFDPTLERRRQTINKTYHVKYNHHLYSVPYTLIGESVELRITQTRLRCFHDGQLIAEHSLGEAQDRTTLTKHMEPKHAHYKGLEKDEMIKWAAAIGPNSEMVIKGQFDERARQFHSTNHDCSGFKKMAKQLGHEDFERLAQEATKRSCYSLSLLKALQNQEGTAP